MIINKFFYRILLTKAQGQVKNLLLDIYVQNWRIFSSSWTQTQYMKHAYNTVLVI